MQRKKKPVWTIKNRIFKLQKIRFSKGVNPCFWSKMPIFSLFRFGQIRLEIMLNYFEEKKETLFDYKKQQFSKSKKSHICQRGYSMLLARKCHFFLSLDLIKIRLEIILLSLQWKKKPFLNLKNRIFQSAKNSIFFQTV